VGKVKMEMNKFLKIIWSVNGVILLLVFLLAGVLVLVQLFDSFRFRSQPEIIVGKELEKAKAEGLILQGLTYDEPRPVLYTDLYILPVSVKTYENPKDANSNRFSLKSSSAEEYSNVVNVIFLDKSFNTESVLLDKKGFIEAFRYPSSQRIYPYHTDSEDTVQHHITYLIAFEDSDKDGALNEQDYSDLYLSDLNGKNLRPITTGVNISEYYFVDRNQILIKYTRRGNQAAEHKKESFALYSIKENQLKDLTSLHDTLNKLEDIIIR
jgi:hypothetical protein